MAFFAEKREMKIESSIEELCSDLVEETNIDYIGIGEVCSRMRRYYQFDCEADFKSTVLNMVRCMLAHGVRPLNFAGPTSGPLYWDETDVEINIGRIKAEWDSLGRDPEVMDICWFGKTR